MNPNRINSEQIDSNHSAQNYIFTLVKLSSVPIKLNFCILSLLVQVVFIEVTLMLTIL